MAADTNRHEQQRSRLNLGARQYQALGGLVYVDGPA